MATPRGKTYTVASGATVAGGRYGTPVWRAAMAANTWAVIPVAATLETLDPKLNPALNPNYPASPEYYAGLWAHIMGAWCGACYDPSRDELHLPLQGGHADYAGNDALVLSIRQDTAAWRRTHPASGYDGTVTTNDGQEATGLYSDGRARAIHSYNKPVWVPTEDAPFIAIQGNVSWSAAAGTYLTIRIDRETGNHTFFGPTNSTIASGSSGGGACYDSTRDAIWWRGTGSGQIGKFDISTKAWTGYTSAAIGGSLSLTYLPEHDCIFIGSSMSAYCRVFDCATGTSYSVTVGGSFADGNFNLGECQPVYVPDMGAIVWWDNASNTTQLNYMTVPANPRTGSWTVQQVVPSGSNAVTPTARSGNGTYGRFAYSPYLDGFALTNTTSGSIYFYARSVKS